MAVAETAAAMVATEEEVEGRVSMVEEDLEVVAMVMVTEKVATAVVGLAVATVAVVMEEDLEVEKGSMVAADQVKVATEEEATAEELEVEK